MTAKRFSSQQPQIFGTQLFRKNGELYTVGAPADTAFISDAVRQAFNVPTLTENQKQIKLLNDIEVAEPRLNENKSLK